MAPSGPSEVALSLTSSGKEEYGVECVEQGWSNPDRSGKREDGGSAATPADVLSNHSAVVSHVVNDN